MSEYEYTLPSAAFTEGDFQYQLESDPQIARSVPNLEDLDRLSSQDNSKLKQKNFDQNLPSSLLLPEDLVSSIEAGYEKTLHSRWSEQMAGHSLEEFDSCLEILTKESSVSDTVNSGLTEVPVEITAHITPFSCIQAPAKFCRKVTLSELVEIFDIDSTEKFSNLYGSTLLPFITPNGLSIQDFQDDHEYVYKTNKRQPLHSLPARYSNEPANYYEPLVVRYRRSEMKEGIDGDGEGLCPYCPANGDYNLFYDRKDSNYLHHVSKLHGVYSSGNEMPFPEVIGTANEVKILKTKGRVSSRVNAVKCFKCEQIVKIQPFDGVSSNKFLAYFRHMLTHNQRKNYGKTKGRSPDL
ncbi:DEKNAAC104828 [Brettanomyces naardenensis]|uniref:DEKNAAC104828 n=1 Tax=Brettanomyces naardenensis TaxID=13370 RepID=A0A448YS27_BRENA|nr:DEKNAAC104828 [Brettanomyces naardenensis]